MRDHLAAFPRRLQQGWDDAAALTLPPAYRTVSRVIVQSMGGSAIAGDVAAEALDSLNVAGPPSLSVHRDYGAPPTADAGTLVIALSHSGHTEEVLSGVEASLAHGANVIALTSGGALATVATRLGLPCHIMPADGGPPRTYLPYALGALLRIMDGLGAGAHGDPTVGRAVMDAVRELARCQPVFAPACAGTNGGNPAKTLARALAGRLPVVIGSRGVMSAAERWKTQINENAKTPAWTEQLPEAHHNAIVGFEGAGMGQRVAVVLLGPADPNAGGPLSERYALTREALEEIDVDVHQPDLPDTPGLSRLLGAALLGDYVSYYLALLNGVDPTPTATLDRVKARLRTPRAVGAHPGAAS